jgi:hypothetical protein
MGIAGADLILMMKLHEAGYLAPRARILDLGAQNLYCDGQEDILSQFVQTFAPDLRVDPARIRALAARGYAGDLFTLAGFTYTCVDVFAAPNGIVLDLNFDPAPPELVSAFDLVMNHGTTEHLLNQFHAFRLMHEFTKPGGVMIHSLPFQGYVDHGFFSYSGKFFKRLAEFNEYKTVEIGFSENSVHTRTPGYIRRAPPSMRAGGRYQSDEVRDASVLAILQRRSSDAFAPPLDVDINQINRKEIAALVSRSEKFVAEPQEWAGRSNQALARLAKRARRYSIIYPLNGFVLRNLERLIRLRDRLRSA